MKKLMLILVVLTVVFASCASPVDEVVEPVNPFEGRWIYVPSGISVEIRDNTWTESGTVIGSSISYTSIFTYEYDDTYFNIRLTDAGFTHLYTTYRYEFKDNNTMLYLYWVPNVYNMVSSDAILQKIGD